jgi:hypothetical protein
MRGQSRSDLMTVAELPSVESQASEIPPRDGHIDGTHFESGQPFASDAEAIEAGLRLGQRKIESLAR